MTDRLLKLSDVSRKAGVGSTWIYNKMKTGAFPRPVKLGERCVRWRESDIDVWIGSLNPTNQLND